MNLDVGECSEIRFSRVAVTPQFSSRIVVTKGASLFSEITELNLIVWGKESRSNVTP